MHNGKLIKHNKDILYIMRNLETFCKVLERDAHTCTAILSRLMFTYVVIRLQVLVGFCKLKGPMHVHRLRLLSVVNLVLIWHCSAHVYYVTLSVIGVGVRLAVCLKGAKIEKSFFWGYVISTLPKLKEMLEGLQVDLRAQFGPLSAL